MNSINQNDPLGTKAMMDAQNELDDRMDAERARVAAAEEIRKTVPARMARNHEIEKAIQRAVAVVLASAPVEEAGALGCLQTIEPRFDEEHLRWVPSTLTSPKGYQFYVSIKEQRQHLSSWRSAPTGKLRIIAGDFGERTNYPERKDGSFNYEAIAQYIVTAMRASRRRQTMNANQAANKHTAEVLREELGMKEWASEFKISASSNGELPVLVEIQIKKSMTPEQARAVHAAMVAAGLVSPKKEG